MDSRTHDGRSYSGEYRLLYKYLRDRFADRVVLTFGEIEDILGFSLPDSARLESGWWSGAAETSSAYTGAWTFASRTAEVNMVSQRVTFDRQMARSS